MREENQLTKKLRSEGYTEDNQPNGYMKYNWFYGGWQYSHKQQVNMVVKTPCGLYHKAYTTIDMGFRGVDWCLENDNVTVICPYRKLGCSLNNPLLKDKTLSNIQVHCEAKITNEPYCYDKSVEKLIADNQAREEERIKEFAKTQTGFCREQLCYNRETGEYYLQHNPLICSARHCKHCDLKNIELSSKKGNVFYDLKITTLQKGVGIIPDEDVITIAKGKRLFDKNISIDVCKWIVESFPHLIDDKVRDKYSSQLFFAKYHGLKFEYEILNIRAEKRAGRDLEQDLEDIAQGMIVTHESDLLAEKKSLKHEKRIKAAERKVAKFRKLVETKGFENLDFSDKLRITKMIDRGAITTQELAEWKQFYQKSLQPQQLSLF